MGRRQTQWHASVNAAKWQSSRRYKLASRWAPFPQVAVFHTAVELRASIERPYPAIDFCFPETSISSHFQGIQESSVTADQIIFPPVVVSVSNLLELLARIRVYGKTYSSRSERLAGEQGGIGSKKPRIHRDKDGYRKSFKIVTYGDKRSGKITRRSEMSIWDAIFPLLAPPLNFEFRDQLQLPEKLYSFQIPGVRFLADNESALLGDDMGTGKTIQTIVAMRLLFQKGSISSALIIVPLVLLKNWDRELEKWAEPLSSVTVVRGNPQGREIQWEQPAHIWITTYGTIRNDIEHILKHRKFDLVVVDEIQNIKNRGTEQTKAIKRLERKRAWGLSGTPIENRIDDIVSIFEFLKPGLLPLEGAYPNMVKRKIKPYFLRRRKKDVLDNLPDKQAFNLWLGLEDKQREAYDSAERNGIVDLKQRGSEITVHHILSLLQKLKQICNRDPQSGESSKLEYLKQELEKIVEKDSKALVFSQYLSEGVDFIKSSFEHYNPAEISGSISGAARDREVERFQKDENCKIIIATPKAGGIGLNLVAGNYVFHFDHWWNPATARQAEDRAHRIGQTKDVFVYHLWMAGTVEERIYEILDRKKKLFADTIDELSNVGGSGLSEEELFGLFGLKSPGKENAKQSAVPYTGDTLAQIIAMNPEDFERLIARLYNKQGYNTRVTPSSRDGGVDVEASKTTTATGREMLAIQCKRYARGNNVGRPDCQKLLGVLSSNRKYTKGIIVTTSDFTQDARAFAQANGRIQLLNGKT